MVKRIGVTLLVLALFLISSVPVFSGGEKEVDTSVPDEVEVNLWSGNAPPDGLDRYRALNLVDAAESVMEQRAAAGEEITINVNPVSDPAGWTDFKRRFNLAAEAGEAPDIVACGHTDVALWGNLGYIVPIADSKEEVKAMYPQFDDVVDGLWDAVTWRDQIWAVPQDTEARPMYYNKELLSEAGWSDAEIEELPDRIKNGDFTLDDLIETAQDAIEKGVVEPGYGYWHRPSSGGDFIQYYKAYGGEIYDPVEDKLVIVEEALFNFFDFHRRIVTAGITPKNFIGTSWDIWHDTVINGGVLFFNAGTWSWGGWSTNQAEGGEAEMFERFGYALQPSGIPGNPGHTLSHPIVYFVTSPKASDNNYQDLWIELVANMTETDLNTRHALLSAHLAILESQLDDPDYKSAEFLSDVSYMSNYNYYAPQHPQYGQWFDALFQGMVSVQQGEVSAEDGTQETINRLKMEIGDQLIVR